MRQKSKRWGSLSKLMLVQTAVCAAAIWFGSDLRGIEVTAHAQSSDSTKSAAQAPTSGNQTPAGTHSNEFPDGPGKKELLQVCTQCHSATLVMANRQDRQGWEDTITKMAGLGANGTDDQYTAILGYLVQNYAPLPSTKKINVNTATAAEIASGLGLSDTDAQAIVAYRTDKGQFKSIDDLKKVPNLDQKKLSASATLVEF